MAVKNRQSKCSYGKPGEYSMDYKPARTGEGFCQLFRQLTMLRFFSKGKVKDQNTYIQVRAPRGAKGKEKGGGQCDESDWTSFCNTKSGTRKCIQIR